MSNGTDSIRRTRAVRTGAAVRLLRKQRLRAIAMGVVALVGACRDDHPDPAGPGGEDSTPPAPTAIVSDPRLAAAPTRAAAARSAAAATQTEAVYVSLQPGTEPNGGLATVRNTHTGSRLPVAMQDGGFDPVRTDARAGDTVAIDIGLVGGGNRSIIVAAPRRLRPMVVRTDPGSGKKDVALNASILVVFSEPVSPGSVGGIQLLRGGAPVSGSTTLSPDGLRATFQPQGLLAPNTVYTLSISTAVADLSGDPLQQPVTSQFTTGTIVVAASVATAQPALITNPFSGDLRTFDMSAVLQKDGRFSGTFSIFYPGIGVRVFGRVTCFTIVGGKAAWIAGVVEGSGDTAAIGKEDGWRAVDNGPPDGGVPDQLSLADPLAEDSLGTAQDYCANMPLGGPVNGELTLNNLISGDIVVNSSGPPPPPPAGMSEIAFAAWPDGGIQVINADGSGGRVLTSTAGDWNPAWSPDGTKLAFDRRGDPQVTGDIYVMGADGSGLKPLTSGAFNDLEPVWSPDGSRIAFQRDGAIYVMNAVDGSGLRPLTGSGCDFYPTWSPDGFRIAFASCRAGTRAIYVMNADGSGVRQLTNDPEGDYFPRWSPDGTRIAFERGTCCAVYVVNPDGTGLRQLALHGRTPSWSRDSRALLFEWYGIHVMNADGTVITPLGAGFDPAWSPVGTLPLRPPPAASVAIAPAVDTLVVGDTVTIVATVKDAAGNVLPGRLVDWSSDSVATVPPGYGSARLVTGVAPGIAKIAAMVDGRTDTATVVVRP